jgi:hypothetical protein
MNDPRTLVAMVSNITVVKLYDFTGVLF